MYVPRPRRAITVLACAGLLAAATACGPAATKDDSGDYPSESQEIVVPAAPGGGWDLTARAIQKVVEDAEISSESIDVVNRDGGGGATALADLTSDDEGDPYQLMIGGLVMIGALQQADSPLKITDATTIATLTSEAEAFVVPADSPFKSIKDVVDAYRKDPESVTFGGGSQGGSDQIVAAMLLQEAGLEAGDMKYIGYPGGGEATAGILSGDVEVGISGLSEFEGQIESGDMRLLALSTDDKVEVAGETAPTLTSEGYDIDFANWRAIFAPPGLSDDEVEAVSDWVDEIHESPEWKQELKAQGWTDDYRTGDEAVQYIEDQQTETAQLLKDLGL